MGFVDLRVTKLTKAPFLSLTVCVFFPLQNGAVSFSFPSEMEAGQQSILLV